jgi:hypothetical protein
MRAADDGGTTTTASTRAGRRARIEGEAGRSPPPSMTKRRGSSLSEFVGRSIRSNFAIVSRLPRSRTRRFSLGPNTRKLGCTVDDERVAVAVVVVKRTRENTRVRRR